MHFQKIWLFLLHFRFVIYYFTFSCSTWPISKGNTAVVFAYSAILKNHFWLILLRKLWLILFFFYFSTKESKSDQNLPILSLTNKYCILVTLWANRRLLYLFLFTFFDKVGFCVLVLRYFSDFVQKVCGRKYQVYKVWG